MILASKSPRRRELMGRLGIDFQVDAADIDEDLGITDPKKLVKELSYRKAEALAEKYPDETIIGSDTVVAIDGAILGKPADDEDARKMLEGLSGRTHQVYTGVSIIKTEGGKIQDSTTFAECTQVTFYPLTDEDINKYLATGEHRDKAGAYGIQGMGALLVKSIEGDYYNVVGLPIAGLYRRLKNF